MKTINSASWNGALAILAALALPASAARLAYEGFDYTEADGTSISGLNGGDFWDEAYPAPGAPLTLQPGLTYLGTNAPLTIGKSMNFGASANMGTGRDWADSVLPPANGTYYYSFQIDPIAAARGTFIIMKSTGSGDGQNGFGIRLDNNGGNPQFKAWNPSQGAGANIDFSGGYGSTYFVVGKITIVNGGTSSNSVSVFNSTGTIPLTEPVTFASTATADATNTALLRATLSGRAFGNNTGYRVDEIRIATTYAEIFPAPAGIPTFALDPITAVQNQTLTFNWTNIPAGSNPTLNGASVTIDGAGTGSTTLPAPAINTTYTLNWTGAAAPLTQQFTAIAPFLTISPTSGYLGDTLTLNWRIPAGSAGITLSPNPASLDLNALTNALTGAGTTPIPAPSATTTYTVNWTGGGAGVSQTFTLLPSFLNVTPDPVADGTTLAINWRISPEWDNNPTAVNEVRIQTSTVANFATLVNDEPIGGTNSTTGAGSSTGYTAVTGVNFFRLVYNINDVETIVSDTIATFDPYFNNLVYTPTATNPSVTEKLNFTSGVNAYLDRDHQWVNVPSVLEGGHFIQLKQGDRNASFEGSPTQSVSFNADEGSTVFVLIDNRVGDGIGGVNPATGSDNPPVASALPWLATNGFLDSGLDIGSDESAPTSPGINNTYSVFFKQVPVGAPSTSFTLGAMDGVGVSPPGRGVYGVVITKPQVVPVSFHAYVGEYDLTLPVPPVTSSTLFWTLPTDATSVSISPTVGSVSIDANGQGNVIVSPTTTTTYTLNASSVSMGPISRTTTVTVVSPPPTETPFETWMSTLYPGITAPNNLPGADPDGDGVSNFGEFAFSGNPGSGSDDGITRSAIDNVSGTNHLTLTFACRTGAAFSGSGPVVSAAVDGVIYTVRGSLNLSTFTEGLTEVTPAIVTGLPAAPSGYEYRTFRVTAAQSANPKAFIQAVANTPAP